MGAQALRRRHGPQALRPRSNKSTRGNVRSGIFLRRRDTRSRKFIRRAERRGKTSYEKKATTYEMDEKNFPIRV